MPAIDFSIAKKKRKALKLVQKNMLVEAKSVYRRLLKNNRNDAESWFMLGTLEGRQGNLVVAGEHMVAALKANPKLAEAWLGYGQVLELQGSLDLSGDAYVKAFSCNPRLLDAYVSLARLCYVRKHYANVIHALESAFERGLEKPKVILMYADSLTQISRLKQAYDIYQEALILWPKELDIHLKLGDLCLKREDLEQAQRHYQRVLAERPDSMDAKLGLVLVARQQGRTQEAFLQLKLLLELQPEDPHLLFLYSRLGNKELDQEALIQRLKLSLKNNNTERSQQRLLSFELGRIYDELSQYDMAFDYYQRGNKLFEGKAETAESIKIRRQIIDSYSSKALAHAARASNDSERPIFIVGMPRSGTSLVEQILASHPQVYAAGELSDLPELIAEHLGQYSDINACHIDVLECIASHYLEVIDGHVAGERYVTDKMPGNFVHLGLISLLFPKARIIHCMRNPVDTCLSCYFQDFDHGHGYSYDLDTLLDEYSQYQMMMAHWNQVLDIPIFEMKYEKLIQDQYGETKALLAFLKLPWDERCIEFYKTERTVITASAHQVDKPIFDSSVARWENYEKYLGPLQRLLQ